MSRSKIHQINNVCKLLFMFLDDVWFTHLWVHTCTDYTYEMVTVMSHIGLWGCFSGFKHFWDLAGRVKGPSWPGDAARSVKIGFYRPGWSFSLLLDKLWTQQLRPQTLQIISFPTDFRQSDQSSRPLLDIRLNAGLSSNIWMLLLQ